MVPGDFFSLGQLGVGVCGSGSDGGGLEGGGMREETGETASAWKKRDMGGEPLTKWPMATSTGEPGKTTARRELPNGAFESRA